MVRYYEESDKELIGSWLTARNIDFVSDVLPKTGVMIENLACGFMYCADDVMGILDWYACDPELSKETREEYFNIITGALIRIAEIKGLKILNANTNHNTLKRVAIENGFGHIGEYSSFLRKV